jgi:hypothetical protein
MVDWRYSSTHSETRCAEFHAPVVLSPLKKPRVTIGQNITWVPELAWTRWRTGQSLALPRIEPLFLCVSARSLVAILTKLSRLPLYSWNRQINEDTMGWAFACGGTNKERLQRFGEEV